MLGNRQKKNCKLELRFIPWLNRMDGYWFCSSHREPAVWVSRGMRSQIQKINGNIWNFSISNLKLCQLIIWMSAVCHKAVSSSMENYFNKNILHGWINQKLELTQSELDVGSKYLEFAWNLGHNFKVYL